MLSAIPVKQLSESTAIGFLIKISLLKGVNECSMNVLIVGGNGFIGRSLAESLLAFEQNVSIIDIADKPKNLKLNSKASYYRIDAISRECREIFEIGQFDIVYYLIGNSDRKNWLESGKDISPLINILDLCCEHRVKKFVYISTSYLYTYEAMNHEMLYKTHPKFFLYCAYKKSCETYCNMYKDVYGLNMLIIRVPPVYGPGLDSNGEGSIVLDIIDAFQHHTYREVWSIFKDIELIYISDLIRILTTTALASNFTGNYKIKGEVLDINYIIRKAKNIFSRNEIKVNFKFEAKMRYPLDKNVINRVEDNTSFSEGFLKTYEWYKSRNLKKRLFADRLYGAGDIIKSLWKKYKAWMEATIFSFLVVEFMKYTGFNYDMAIVLVMIIGLTYGINVALYTGALCMFLHYFPFSDSGLLDLMNLNTLERFLAYFSIALISGYKKSVEIKENKIKKFTHIELEELFKTVQADLVNTRKSASLLTEQLKTYEYSYSNVYNAIKTLNENRKRITQILPEVINELTGFKEVKLETRNDLSKYQPGLDYDMIKNSFEKNEVFFNTQLQSSIRIIVPVFNRKTKKVDSLIVIRNVPFEKMNVNVESQMYFIYNLVTDFYNANID